MMLTQVDIPALSVSSRFLTFEPCSGQTTSGANALVRHCSDVIIDHTPSTVVYTHGRAAILKLIKARSWHEHAKTWWAHNRLFKEVRGNRLLQKLGLQVASIHEVGINPFSGSRGYLGYFVMEDLSLRGAREVHELLGSGEANLERRAKIFKNIITDLKIMRDAGVIFSDCHLKNIFVGQDDQVIWIDTGVTRYCHPNGKRFRKKFNYSMERFSSYELDEPVRRAEESALIRSLLL